ncbi:CysS/YqeB C-terminal domain-containing protein [Streptomyces silaceus]|uniref:CysS/YqeB C-terminal domain-containing protein n=1 Tax=Streptomyces silaceus TaxID=545123 RepID=UPI0006EB930E|nr:hypothetical protein [Streptomyces silaceus]
MSTGAPLRLRNSLHRGVEAFRPSGSAGGEVGLYSCGPIAFASPHLGILRGYVCVDLLRRALRWKGFPVRHAVMITDVVRARVPDDVDPELHVKEFHDGLAALNVLPADHYPRASEYVDEMIGMARELERTGHAYRLGSGLYFDTSRSAGYGAIARMHLEGQRDGASAESVPGRRNPSDFALWRLTGPGDDPRDTARTWDSPWGRGLPGSHLPCSATSTALLGAHFDLHTGGRHHRALHHVNEIAQSEACLADGRPWVGHWLHHGALTHDDRPMTRGTAPHVADLTAAGLHPMAFRLLLLRGHYRRDLAYTRAGVAGAQATLRRLLSRRGPAVPVPDVVTYEQARLLLPPDDTAALRALDRMDAAMCADLNTAQVLTELQEAVRAPDLTDRGLGVVLASADALLGLRLTTLDPGELALRTGELPLAQRRAVEELVAARAAARARRDWQRADAIRAQLSRIGVAVTDAGDRSDWTLSRGVPAPAESEARP